MRKDKTRIIASIITFCLIVSQIAVVFSPVTVHADTWSDTKTKYGIPADLPATDSKYGLPFNLSYWQSQSLAVYGTPLDVLQKNPPNDYVSGQWRYLGFTKDGERFTNQAFKNENPNEPADGEKNWIKYPWKEISGVPDSMKPEGNDWSTKSYFANDVNNSMAKLGFLPNGEPHFGYAFVQSYPWYNKMGSAREIHKEPNGYWYKTFSMPQLDTPRQKPALEVDTEILSNNFHISRDETTVNVDVKVTAHLKDESIYGDETNRVLWYTRDNVTNWWIKLTVKVGASQIYESWVEIKPNGSNTVSSNFTVPVSRGQVVDGSKVDFIGKGTVKFDNGDTDSDTDIKSRIFTVEPGPTPPLPPGLTLIAPEEVGINEQYQVILRTNLPEGQTVTGLTLQKSFNGGSISNAALSTIAPESYATESYPAEGTVNYTGTVTISNGQTATATAKTNVVDKRVASGKAGISLRDKYNFEPSHYLETHETYDVWVNNENKFYYEGNTYGPKAAHDMGIGSSRFNVYDNSKFKLSASLYETKDRDDNDSMTINFKELGTYKIGCDARPLNGNRDEDVAAVVVKPCPDIVATLLGARKSNRKLTLDFSKTYVNAGFPLDNSKTYVVIEDQDTRESVKVTNASHPISTNIKTRAMSDNKLDFLIKADKVKHFRATIYVEDTRGKSDTEEIPLDIQPDLPPVADLIAAVTDYRDSSGKAGIKIGKAGKSVDGDRLKVNSLKYRVDTNNNGSFEDETLVDLSGSLTQLDATITTDKVGKIQLDYTVQENLTPETLPEFVSESDYLSAHMTKIIDVDNLSPHTSLRAIAGQNMDFMFAIKEGDRTQYDGKIGTLQPAMNTSQPVSVAVNGVNEMDIGPNSGLSKIAHLNDYASILASNGNGTGIEGFYITDNTFIYYSNTGGTEPEKDGIYGRDIKTGVLKYRLELKSYQLRPIGKYLLHGNYKTVGNVTTPYIDIYDADTGSLCVSVPWPGASYYVIYYITVWEDDQNIYYAYNGTTFAASKDNFSYRTVEPANYTVPGTNLGEKDGYVYSAKFHFEDGRKQGLNTCGVDLYKTNKSTGESTLIKTAAKQEPRWYWEYARNNDYWQNLGGGTYSAGESINYVSGKLLDNGNIFVVYRVGNRYKSGKHYEYFSRYNAVMFDSNGNVLRYVQLIPGESAANTDTTSVDFTASILETKKYVGFQGDARKLFLFDKNTGANVMKGGTITNMTISTPAGSDYSSMLLGQDFLDDLDRNFEAFASGGYIDNSSNDSEYMVKYDLATGTYVYIYSGSSRNTNISIDYYKVYGTDRYMAFYGTKNPEYGDHTTFQIIIYDTYTRQMYTGNPYLYISHGSFPAFYKGGKIYLPGQMRLYTFDTTTKTFAPEPNYGSDTGVVWQVKEPVKYVSAVKNWTTNTEVNVYKLLDTIRILGDYANDFTPRENAKNYAVVIFDGDLTGTDPQDITDAANALKAKGIKLVWFGNASNKSVADAIIQQTGGAYFPYMTYSDVFTQLPVYLKGDLPPRAAQYVLKIHKGDVIGYDKFYFDLENDAQIPSTVKWYYRQTPSNEGTAVIEGKTLSQVTPTEFDHPITSFNTNGTYYVSWGVQDNPKPADSDTRFAPYRRTSIREELQIIVGDGTIEPPTEQVIPPTVKLNVSGYLKQNQKVIVTGNITPGNQALDNSKTTWIYTAISGGTAADIKVKDISSTEKNLLFKKAGRYHVKVTIQDIKGNKATDETDIDIIPDNPPTAAMTLTPLIYRNYDGSAINPVKSTITSPDDYIQYVKYYLQYDSNNDGSFDGEAKTELPAYQDLNMFDLTVGLGVGNYQLTIEAKEGWREDTIPEFISDADYLRTSTTATFKVDNVAPHYLVRTDKEVYLVGDKITYISGYTDEDMRGDVKRGYYDEENDPMDSFTVKYTQNKDYMPKSDSASSYNNVTLNGFVDTLDKAGEYKLEVVTKDNPKPGDSRFDSFKQSSTPTSQKFIVHRPPKAQAVFQAVYDVPGVAYDFGNLMYLEGTRLTIYDDSYDPDGFAVKTKLSYKVGKGSYAVINSGDTINLEYGNDVVIKVETEDNWHATDTNMYVIRVVNNLDMIPGIVPSPVPASETVTLWLKTNQYATSARCVIEGNNTPLQLVSETATQKVWNNTYTIPATRWGRSGTPYEGVSYTAQFYAVSEGLVELRKDKDYIVKTPIDLKCMVPSEDGEDSNDLITDEEVVLQAATTKYATSVEVTLYKGTKYKETLLMVLSSADGDHKHWKVSYTPTNVVPEGEYFAEFIARTPGVDPQTDSPEVKTVRFNLRALKLQNLRITNICDYRWKDLFMKADRQPTALQKEGIHVNDMPVYDNKQRYGIKLGYAVDFKIDSIGLNHKQDTINIDVNYYALDRINTLHPVDIYVKNNEGNYVLIQNSEYADKAKNITLGMDQKSAYETDPSITANNTWSFSFYLPPTAKAVEHGKELDLVNDNSYDYKLLVTFGIIGKRLPDTVYDYTWKEANWSVGDGNVYGRNRPTNLDLLGKGTNHGEVFWYLLDETALDDLQINREW